MGNKAKPKVHSNSKEKIIQTVCSLNCDSRCLTRMHVENDKIVRVSPGDFPGVPTMQTHVYVEFHYHSEPNLKIVKYPLKRVGKRGEGKFERISWEEAWTLLPGN